MVSGVRVYGRTKVRTCVSNRTEKRFGSRVEVVSQ